MLKTKENPGMTLVVTGDAEVQLRDYCGRMNLPASSVAKFALDEFFSKRNRGEPNERSD